MPFKPEVAGSSPAWRISPIAQLVELRNTTQQHRKSKPLLCPSWSKEMDLSSIGVLLRAGSNPAGSILWMDHSNYYIFSWFSPMTGGFDPRGGADHCLGGRKKSKIHPANFIRAPHSNSFRNQTFNLIMRSQWYSYSNYQIRSYSVVVSTSDFESGDPSSILGRTFCRWVRR